MLIIHSRARPHLEMLEATDHNLSRIFSLSTNVKVDVYVLTAPNARAKINPRPQDRMVRGLLSPDRRRAERSDHGLLLRSRLHSRPALGRDLLRRLLSVGSAFWGTYVADKGFEGAENHRRWLECYGAEVIHPPKRNSKKPWSKPLRRWVAGIRQIIETVYDKLFNAFGLWGERPHEIEGLRARLAARE
jgi:hypothetical protein